MVVVLERVRHILVVVHGQHYLQRCDSGRALYNLYLSLHYRVESAFAFSCPCFTALFLL